ncbi:MAG: hypothetical protein E7812_05750 [Phenylobacterium sp.]|nr:MAG: hypothetical protein E7812_05750 [Phenylobacterium sp.]
MAGVGGCALVSACVGNPFRDAQIDPSSPVAAEVARIVPANTTYPTFAGIPAMPKDVRPVKQYGRDAAAVEKTRAQLERQTAPETWSLSDTEAFAAKARAEAGDEPAPTASGDTADFANTQRKRATPPPPPPN